VPSAASLLGGLGGALNNKKEEGEERKSVGPAKFKYTGKRSLVRPKKEEKRGLDKGGNENRPTANSNLPRGRGRELHINPVREWRTSP